MNLPLAPTSPPVALWTVVWREVVSIVEEARVALAQHLRDGALAARPRDELAYGLGGELRIGRTRLHLDCLAEPARAGDAEARFAAAFDAEARLVRIVVHRLSGSAPPMRACVLAIDPSAEVWCSSDDDVPPARLDDRLALERFVWGLLVDSAR